MEKSSSKLKSIAILALALVLVLGAILYANGKLYNKTAGAFAGKGFAVVGEISAMSSKNSSVYFVDDLMLEIQSQIIKGKNIGGTIAWSEKIPGIVTKVANAGENIIIADSTRNLSCLSKKGKVLWSFSLPYDCMELYAQENGNVLVEYKNSSGCRFDVLDSKGGKLGSGLVENAYLLSFSSGEQELFSISVLDVSSDSVKSKVLTYNFKGEIVWANNFDNEIISSIAYGKSNNLILVGDKCLYKYKPSGKLAAKQELPGGIVNAYTDGALVAITAKDKGEPEIICFDSNLKKTGSNHVERMPEGVCLLKSSFAIFNKDEFDIYDMKCSRIAEYDSPIDILGMNIVDGGKFYLISNRKLQLLESR